MYINSRCPKYSKRDGFSNQRSTWRLCLALKKNQKTFYDDVKDYLDDIDILKEIKKENYAEDVEKSHSKIITRKYYMTSKISWLENKEKWEKLKSIGVEKKTIESIQTGEVTEENRYL